MSEQASGERLYSNKMLWSPNDDVLDSGMTRLERNGFENHELSINDASLWTELNYTVQSYRLSSVDSSVADFIVNSNPVHSKDYIFDQADSIGVLPVSSFHGVANASLELIIVSDVFGERPRRYQVNYVLRMMGVASEATLSVMVPSGSIEYGTTATLTLSSSTMDVSENLRIEFRPADCTVLSEVTFMSNLLTSTDGCIYILTTTSTNVENVLL